LLNTLSFRVNVVFPDWETSNTYEDAGDHEWPENSGDGALEGWLHVKEDYYIFVMDPAFYQLRYYIIITYNLKIDYLLEALPCTASTMYSTIDLLVSLCACMRFWAAYTNPSSYIMLFSFFILPLFCFFHLSDLTNLSVYQSQKQDLNNAVLLDIK
jgi:hypothetical protein